MSLRKRGNDRNHQLIHHCFFSLSFISVFSINLSLLLSLSLSFLFLSLFRFPFPFLSAPFPLSLYFSHPHIFTYFLLFFSLPLPTSFLSSLDRLPTEAEWEYAAQGTGAYSILPLNSSITIPFIIIVSVYFNLFFHYWYSMLGFINLFFFFSSQQ